MATFDALLDLQQLDTAITQLGYRRSHLPEQEQLNDEERRLAALETSLAPDRDSQAAFEQRQAALELQIQEIDVKIDGASKQLYGGGVTSPRELQALEADIASLKRHRSELEDVELQILMDREPVDATMADGAGRREALDAEAARLRVVVAEAVVQIDREHVELTSQRAVVVAALDPVLLETYERIRKRNKGIGVARLDHGTCMSCRLKLSAVHLDALRKLPAIEVALCEECGAILVR